MWRRPPSLPGPRFWHTEPRKDKPHPKPLPSITVTLPVRCLLSVPVETHYQSPDRVTGPVTSLGVRTVQITEPPCPPSRGLKGTPSTKTYFRAPPDSGDGPSNTLQGLGPCPRGETGDRVETLSSLPSESPPSVPSRPWWWGLTVRKTPIPGSPRVGDAESPRGS